MRKPGFVTHPRNASLTYAGPVVDMTSSLSLIRDGKKIDAGQFCDFLAALHTAMNAPYQRTYCLFWRAQSNKLIESYFNNLETAAWKLWPKFVSGKTLLPKDVKPLRVPSLT